jgi:phage terminase large subunit
MVRKTLESLKASALVTFQNQVLHEFDGKRSVMDGVDYFGGNTIRPAQFTYQRTGAVIILGGLDKSSKVLSTEYDLIYANECTELTLDEWEKLAGRVDRPSLDTTRPPSVLLGDCNPDAPTHWVMQRANEHRLQLWPTTHRDNPAMWDRKRKAWTEPGRRYLEERLGNLTGVRRQRLLEGLWIAAEGAVYAFDRLTHVTPNPFSPARQAVATGAGVDWGFTNPGVILVGQMDGDGRLCVTREVYQTRQTIDWWIARAQTLQRQYGIDWFACDPSEPAYIEQFRHAGLNAFPAQNPILPGIDAVAQRLRVADDGLPRLTFAADMNREPDAWLTEHKRPLSVVEEFDSYIWDTRAGRKEKPIDDANHALDALRYLVMQFDHKQGSDWAHVEPADLARVLGGRS